MVKRSAFEDGIFNVLGINGYRIRRSGKYSLDDVENLRKDWYNVGQDLQRAINQYQRKQK